MANTHERLVKWILIGHILQMEKPLEDKKAVAVIFAAFDLSKLFPAIDTMTDIQKNVIAYGVKQKLSDKGSGDIADQGGKVETAKRKFQELVEGKWAGERMNATGAAETKKTVAALKEASKEVSLTGLIMKQAMSKFPGGEPFTEADAAKLAQFLEIAAKQNIKK